jgi:hypothetical protein
MNVQHAIQWINRNVLNILIFIVLSFVAVKVYRFVFGGASKVDFYAESVAEVGKMVQKGEVKIADSVVAQKYYYQLRQDNEAWIVKEKVLRKYGKDSMFYGYSGSGNSW